MTTKQINLPLTDMAVNGTDNTALLILISSIAAIGGFLFGFDSGVINGTVDGLRLAFKVTLFHQAVGEITLFFKPFIHAA